ncbi:MAG: TlpA family protein disulfide reductase [Methylobacter sp.]|nr:MAG: TlpA family protein disulfide reductase [Methylobacter sp.]
MNQRIIILLCLALGSVQTLSAAEQGDAIPDCTLSAVGGDTRYNLKSLQGKVLYVDFWASWCGPCAKSFPFLNHLDHQFKEQGLQVIGINLDEKPTDAQDFLAQYPADFMIASGSNQQCAMDFGVKAMPSSYLVDRKGHIRHIHLGFKAGEAEQLTTLIEQLLAEH